MASSEHPQTSPLTKEAPAETPPVPLPPLPRTPTIDAPKILRRRGRLDAVLAVLVLLFAFLVASFPTINTDFFRHVAMGRLIAHGNYHFGVDPFIYTGGDTYFVNHSWLYDLILYALYQLPSGGAVVVIVKALLTVALAVVLLYAGRRAGQSLWIPALCTALAILVVSPRLFYFVQPTCLSFLFLGVTLWILTAEERLWLLPPLFVLWVNCDSWFFLGPLTVALYLVGELTQQRTQQPATSARPSLAGATGWFVLAVGIAVCLLNPHHVRALTLPPEFGLSAAGDLLEQDPQFSQLFLSPLAKGYYSPYAGLSVAGLAYWPLLLLSLISFGVAVNRVSWPRLLVWTVFALLSLYNYRIIPFFAVVAGPIMALNWLDFAVQRFGPEPRLSRPWRTWGVAGRVFSFLLLVLLLIATVPGWIQRSRPTFHRIDWSVQVDPSLQAMAESIRSWREAGLLPEEPNWFSLDHDTANYLAWFAPGERVFLDQSLPFFREAAEDYLTVRQGLEQEVKQDSTEVKTDWQKVLRDRQVRFWIYEDRGMSIANQVSRAILFANWQDWTLCHLQGRIAIFAWRDPKRPPLESVNKMALDLKRSAFGPKAETAPPQGAEPAPPRDWWHTALDVWWSPDPAQTADRESPALYEFRFHAVDRPQQIHAHSRTWQTAVATAGIAGAIPGGPVPSSLLNLSWSCTYNDLFPPGAVQPTRPVRESEKPAMQSWESYVSNQFLQSPSLFLAVRAARRALVVDPEDAPTYFRLGKIYQLLRDLPQESLLRKLGPQLAPALVDTIRRTQMIAAFQNALRLGIDDEKTAEAHEALYMVYARELGYIDAAVRHLRLSLDKRSVLGPPPGMSPTTYNQTVEQMNAQLAQLDNELGRRMDRYDVNTASKSGLEKVQAALREGLSETALTVLEQEPDLDVTSPVQVALVKALTGVALDLGMVDKARELLPDPGDQPIKPEELDLHLRLAAARGDYAAADRFLDEALHHVWQAQPGQSRMTDPAMQVAPLVGRVLLSEARHLMGAPTIPWTPNDLGDIFRRSWLGRNPSDYWRRRWRMEAIINGMMAARQQGEWELVRGWLALEAGHCEQARKHFETVRAVAVPGDNWMPEVARLNAWLEDQSEPRAMQQVSFRHILLNEQSLQYLNWLKEESNP